MALNNLIDARTAVILVMLSLVLIMLIIDFFIFIEANRQIGLYNEKRLENCLLLECDVNPLGAVECRTPINARDLDGVPPSVKIIKGNGSGVYVPLSTST